MPVCSMPVCYILVCWVLILLVVSQYRGMRSTLYSTGVHNIPDINVESINGCFILKY